MSHALGHVTLAALVGGLALLGGAAVPPPPEPSPPPAVAGTSPRLTDAAAAPTAVSPACARTVLRYGSRGYCVTELQLNLNILFGLGLAMDGSYGPATTSAVYWFQKRYGLTYDGITGPQTWSKIAWCLSRARAGLP